MTHVAADATNVFESCCARIKTAKLRLQNALRRCAARGQLMRGDQSACAVWRPLASLGFPYNCQTALATCMATLLAACGSGWNSVGEWMHNNVWKGWNWWKMDG